jgi:hypothetical protein
MTKLLDIPFGWLQTVYLIWASWGIPRRDNVTVCIEYSLIYLAKQ